MEDGAVLQCSAYIVDIDDTVGEIVLFQINRNISDSPSKPSVAQISVTAAGGLHLPGGLQTPANTRSGSDSHGTST